MSRQANLLPDSSWEIPDLPELADFLKRWVSVIQKTKKKKQYLKIWSDLAEPGSSILVTSAERFRHALKYTMMLKVKEKYPSHLETGTEHQATLISLQCRAENYPWAFKNNPKPKPLVAVSTFHITNLLFSVCLPPFCSLQCCRGCWSRSSPARGSSPPHTCRRSR